MNPGVRLRVGHQQSRFFADSDLFRGLLLTVLGVPEGFPRLTIPRVPLRVRRQTLTVLDHSDPLHGLLLTVLGS